MGVVCLAVVCFSVDSRDRSSLTPKFELILGELHWFVSLPGATKRCWGIPGYPSSTPQRPQKARDPLKPPYPCFLKFHWTNKNFTSARERETSAGIKHLVLVWTPWMWWRALRLGTFLRTCTLIVYPFGFTKGPYFQVDDVFSGLLECKSNTCWSFWNSTCPTHPILFLD